MDLGLIQIWHCLASRLLFIKLNYVRVTSNVLIYDLNFQQEKEGLKNFQVEEEEEDKEQCSPVSVLDPPFEDDDEEHDEEDEEHGFDMECSYAIMQSMLYFFVVYWIFIQFCTFVWSLVVFHEHALTITQWTNKPFEAI